MPTAGSRLLEFAQESGQYRQVIDGTARGYYSNSGVRSLLGL